MNVDAKYLAHILGGEVKGRDTVACPGPGHSPRDRSLSVKLDPNAPDGFLLYSHAGDDWRVCRDHVRAKLGLPPWEPGDEQPRSVPQKLIDKWDFAVVEAEANEPPRGWSEDEAIRVNAAREIWSEARDPRGTLGDSYWQKVRKLDAFTDGIAGNVLRFHPRCPWRNQDTGRIERVPALVACFRSVDDDSITAVHRIRAQPGCHQARARDA